MDKIDMIYNELTEMRKEVRENNNSLSKRIKTLEKFNDKVVGSFVVISCLVGFVCEKLF